MTPFIVQNLKKSLKSIQSYENMPILTQNGTFTPSETFFRKTINTIIMCLLAPFNVQNFKKSLGWIQSFEEALFRPFYYAKF